MWIVWDKARFTLILSIAFVLTTAALAIANLMELAGLSAGLSTGNKLDSEVIPTFGDNSIGLAAAFMSLASNVCATGLVGLKVWYGNANRSCWSQRLKAVQVPQKGFGKGSAFVQSKHKDRAHYGTARRLGSRVHCYLGT